MDSAGEAYVTGSTESTDFPTTPGGFQTVCNGGSGCSTYGDAFVTKLNPTGSGLVYSTYLDGTLENGNALAIVVDSWGYAYVTGAAGTGFPTTPGAFQTKCPACGRKGLGAGFVTKFNLTGSALLYSTYLGGGGRAGESAQQQGTGITLDSADNAYVTGYTNSTKFPTTKGAFQTTLVGSVGRLRY